MDGKGKAGAGTTQAQQFQPPQGSAQFAFRVMGRRLSRELVRSRAWQHADAPAAGRDGWREQRGIVEIPAAPYEEADGAGRFGGELQPARCVQPEPAVDLADHPEHSGKAQRLFHHVEHGVAAFDQDQPVRVQTDGRQGRGEQVVPAHGPEYLTLGICQQAADEQAGQGAMLAVGTLSEYLMERASGQAALARSVPGQEAVDGFDTEANGQGTGGLVRTTPLDPSDLQAQRLQCLQLQIRNG